MGILKKLIILILTGALISCNSSKNLERVEFHFKPSFDNPTKFIVDFKNKTFEELVIKDRYYVKKKIDSNSYQKLKRDTLVILHQGIASLKNKDLRALKNGLNNLDTSTYLGKPMLDGISYKVLKIRKSGDTISLVSNITNRDEESRLQYSILDPFFELARKTITDDFGVYGIDMTQSYFDFGLPIEQISSKPLEYRIWGILSGCKEDNKELITFLENLPSDEPVIFNLSSAHIAPCLNEAIEEFKREKELYFYGGRNGKYSSIEEVFEVITTKHKEEE